MVEIIAGEKGKGKTKYLLDKVNDSVKSASGGIPAQMRMLSQQLPPGSDSHEMPVSS